MFGDLYLKNILKKALYSAKASSGALYAFDIICHQQGNC